MAGNEDNKVQGEKRIRKFINEQLNSRLNCHLKLLAHHFLLLLLLLCLLFDRPRPHLPLPGHQRGNFLLDQLRTEPRARFLLPALRNQTFNIGEQLLKETTQKLIRVIISKTEALTEAAESRTGGVTNWGRCPRTQTTCRMSSKEGSLGTRCWNGTAYSLAFSPISRRLYTSQKTSASEYLQNGKKSSRNEF